MIYSLLAGVCAYLGLSSGLGSTTLLRPLLDAIAPLSPLAIATLCTIATLGAALVHAFFALSQPIPLALEELVLLAVGAMLGGVAGDLASWRFMLALGDSVVLLQNALLFALIALSALYFSNLAQSITPLALPRVFSFPVALGVGLLGSFLSFGAEPVTLALYFLLFDAEDDESAIAALTVALFAMLGRLTTLLIRQRFVLPGADALIWLLPGAVIGAGISLLTDSRRVGERSGSALLGLSLFTSLVNMAASAL